MKRFSRLSICLAIFIVASSVWTELAVQNIQVQQRWPWNGLVDIDYEIVCNDPDADIVIFFSGKDGDLNQQIKMTTLTGDGADLAPVKPGKHRITWNMTEDAPGLHSTAFTVHIEACQGNGLYLVIDLSGGPDAESWPYEYSIVGPDLTDDSCRTDKLWLRFIPPNTSSVDDVNVDYGFYMGIFEVTQRQYQLIMGDYTEKFRSYFGSGLSTNERVKPYLPMFLVSYNAIRGTSEGATYPENSRVDADSFMGKLRAKTGLNADLPTNVQWMYACYAGEIGVYGELDDIAWHSGNSSTGVGSYAQKYQKKVGAKLANPWGLYDMYGNVREWTRDWYGTDKKYRTQRGGSGTDTLSSTFGPKNYWYYTPNTEDIFQGFRLAIVPAGE